MRVCPKCKRDLPEDQFGMRKSRTGTIITKAYCTPCKKLYNRGYYKENSTAFKARTSKRNVEVVKTHRDLIAEYLRKHPCIDCGNSDIRVLEFDHIQGTKIKNVSNMVRGSTKALIREIDKCEVRCRNCHKLITDIRAKVWWTHLPEFK